jgi:preprotein translocase subunit SecE
MADEKKKALAKATSETAKSDKKEKKDKKPSKFSPKTIFKGIVKFFKDLRGETKKIVWPSRQMVLKSTGIVLAAILVIGAGIWIIDFALSSGVTALNDAAANRETTVATTVAETESTTAA